VGERTLHETEWRVDPEVYHAIPGCRVGLLDGCEDDEAGIVHENVDPLEPFDCELDDAVTPRRRL